MSLTRLNEMVLSVGFAFWFGLLAIYR